MSNRVPSLPSVGELTLETPTVAERHLPVVVPVPLSMVGSTTCPFTDTGMVDYPSASQRVLSVRAEHPHPQRHSSSRDGGRAKQNSTQNSTAHVTLE
jgi:hypothetical protein